jgi:hypothetical protein
MEASGVIKKYMFYNLLFPCNKIEVKEISEYFAKSDRDKAKAKAKAKVKTTN